MNSLELKKNIRKIVPNWMIKPLLNIYRFIKFLFIYESNNSHDLRFLHDIQLDRLKANNNQRNFLVKEYAELHADLSQKELCRAKEFKVSSQHGEDGLIMYIFSKIGVKSYNFIEFGAGGKTSNTENLIVNFGWSGLLIDGSKEALEDTKSRYKSYNIHDDKVKALCSWITKDNINELFMQAGFNGEVDLLSIDIDGNDYWIWKAINSIKPRVVVVEYNGSFGNDRAITIKYNETHNKFDYHPLGWYHGASLKAFEKLANKKGYSLIACESNGVNAFFVRDDLMEDKFIKLSSDEAFYKDTYREIKVPQKEQFRQIKHLEMVEV